MFCEYSKNGISFKIPKKIKVRSDFPNFFGESRAQAMTFAVTSSSESELLDSWEGMVKARLGNNPTLDSRIIREGEVFYSCPGYERIVEHQLIDTDDINATWIVLLSLKEHNVLFMATSNSKFTDFEETCKCVIDSLSFTTGKAKGVQRRK